MNGIDFDYIDESKPEKGLAKWAKMQMTHISSRDLAHAITLDVARNLLPMLTNINLKNVYQASYMLGVHDN